MTTEITSALSDWFTNITQSVTTSYTDLLYTTNTTADGNGTTGYMSTTTSTPLPTSPEPTKEYVAADFEVLLPCIFGLVVTLALVMVSFYMNKPDDAQKMNSDKSHLIVNGPAECTSTETKKSAFDF